ncbi:MAG TPA: DinB family protein [Pirellulales bacterium]|nr:DinB family protein [Pirellulales bacterium]
MLELYKQTVLGQFEAALAMLKQCIAACPSEHWESKIANNTFRYVAYHTLFFADYYLSPGEQAFQLRELHQRGGDERGEAASIGLSQPETLEYVRLVHQKLRDVLAAETEQSLAGPSGIARRKCCRAELHLYNLRHIQHHTGAMYAYLRRVDPALADNQSLPWISTGWR